MVITFGDDPIVPGTYVFNYTADNGLGCTTNQGFKIHISDGRAQPRFVACFRS